MVVPFIEYRNSCFRRMDVSHATNPPSGTCGSHFMDSVSRDLFRNARHGGRCSPRLWTRIIDRQPIFPGSLPDAAAISVAGEIFDGAGEALDAFFRWRRYISQLRKAFRSLTGPLPRRRGLGHNQRLYYGQGIDEAGLADGSVLHFIGVHDKSAYLHWYVFDGMLRLMDGKMANSYKLICECDLPAASG